MEYSDHMGQKASGIGPFARAVNAELRAHAARRGYRQRALADRSGIPQATISKVIYMENSALTVHNLEAICVALEVSPVDIVAAAEKATHQYTQQNYRLAAKADTRKDVSEEDYD